MSDVFISYARSTARQAHAAAEVLRELGYTVWLDEDLPAHRTYAHVIEEQLDAAKAALVIWSADAVRSEWVLSEANRAREQRKLVQFTLDGARLPLPFDAIQCTDLTGWSGDASAPGWRRVVAGITDLVGAAPQPSTLDAKAAVDRSRSRPANNGLRRGLMGASVAVAAVAVILIAGWAALNAYRTAEAAQRTTPQALRAALASYLATADCAWLNAEPEPVAGGMAIKLSGLAGDPGMVEKQAATAIESAGLKAAVDISALNRVDAKACGPLNIFLKFRDPSTATGDALATPRTAYRLENRPHGCDPAYGRQASAMTALDVKPPADFTLIGMEPTGALQQVIADRANFLADAKLNPALFTYSEGLLVFYSCVDERTAARTPLAIEVLVKGRGPFDLSPLNINQVDTIAVDAEWADRFWANARTKGWTTQIVWFRLGK